MIKNIFIEPDRSTYSDICQRPKVKSENLNAIIAEIFEKVDQEGDKALLAYTEKFDKVSLPSILVTKEETEAAESKVSSKLKEAIRLAKKNITTFHQEQKNPTIEIETIPGVRCIQKSVGIG